MFPARRRKSPPLFTLSPLWSFLDDAMLGLDMSLTRMLCIGGFDGGCAADDILNSLSTKSAGVLSSLPEGSILRFHSVSVTPDHFILSPWAKRMRENAIGRCFADEKQPRLLQSTRRRELFASLTLPSEHTAKPQRRRFLVPPKKTSGKLSDRAAALEHACSQLRSGLQSLSITSTLLKRGECFLALWEMTNPAYSMRGHLAPTLGTATTLRSQLTAYGILSGFGHFIGGNIKQRVLAWRLPPRDVQPLALAGVQALPFPHMLTVTLRRQPDDEARSRIEGKRRQGHEVQALFGKLRGQARNAALPDHGLLSQQYDADDALACLSRGEALFDVAFQLWLGAEDTTKLQQRTDAALSAIRRVGDAEAACEDMRGAEAFFSMLPGHASSLGDRYHPMLASRAADILPLSKASNPTKDPLALLTTRQRELVGFDPFSPELRAWNATVAGSAGSGKSFMVRLLLAGWVATGGGLVVVTRGRDYEAFAKLFGASLFNVDAKRQDLGLCPFASTAGADDLAGLETLEHVLATMVADGERLNREDKHILRQALRAVLVSKNWSFQHLIDTLQNTDQRGPTMARQLEIWLDSALGPALRRNAPKGSPVEIWNLAPVRDADSQALVLAMLSGRILSSIRRQRTIVLLDEVWSLLKSPSGAELIENLYRTVRKEGSSIWTISQSMNDFSSLPKTCRSAILNNSEMKFFLPHDASEAEVVRTAFGLNNRETALLKSLRSVPGRFSECLAFIGERHQVLRLEPTPSEYWAATSHPRDVEERDALLATYPQLKPEETLRLLAKRFPRGAVHA